MVRVTSPAHAATERTTEERSPVKASYRATTPVGTEATGRVHVEPGAKQSSGRRATPVPPEKVARASAGALHATPGAGPPHSGYSAT